MSVRTVRIRATPPIEFVPSRRNTAISHLIHGIGHAPSCHYEEGLGFRTASGLEMPPTHFRHFIVKSIITCNDPLPVCAKCLAHGLR
jgi:hypothetical protein